MIRLEGIRHRSLHIPSLVLPDGRCAIIGPNGSGKTTLLRLCAGIDLPEEGQIQVNEREPREAEVGWVGEFPDRSLLFERVRDEIASPLRFRHAPCVAVEERVNTIAALLGIRSLLDRRTRELSGGERVLTALGAALAARCELLVLDEYDAHMDRDTREIAEEAIRGARIPMVLYATQQMDTAASADWIVYLERGRPCCAGTPVEVFSRLRWTCFYPPSWEICR